MQHNSHCDSKMSPNHLNITHIYRNSSQYHAHKWFLVQPTLTHHLSYSMDNTRSIPPRMLSIYITNKALQARNMFHKHVYEYSVQGSSHKTRLSIRCSVSFRGLPAFHSAIQHLSHARPYEVVCIKRFDFKSQLHFI